LEDKSLNLTTADSTLHDLGFRKINFI